MLDLSAAFDTVDHNILIQRLSLTFGIKDTALQWFSSYLSERFQSVHFAGNTSPSTHVVCGVPQGSVLGPLLFLLYTSDIWSIASKHHINSHSFADDTRLYLSGNPKDTQLLRSSIVACINEITEWCAANKLKLNPNKTEFLWGATTRRQNQLDHSPIDLSDGNIRPSKAVRDLGVMIDSQLAELRSAREQHRLQMLCRAPSNQIIPPFPTNRCRAHSGVFRGGDWAMCPPPLWPKKSVFHHRKNFENLVWPPLCVSTSGQQKFGPPPPPFMKS